MEDLDLENLGIWNFEPYLLQNNNPAHVDVDGINSLKEYSTDCQDKI